MVAGLGRGLRGLLGEFRGSKAAGFRRVKTPVVLQIEAVECGAAALGIVLAHHGLWIPLERLRVLCGVTRDGSKASNILKAARGFGMTARGFSKEPRALCELPLPMVVFWNFNHFLVVEGFAEDGVFLNDPGGGHRKVDWDEFDLSFTGVVLTFEPGRDFKPGGEAPSVLRGLADRISSARRMLPFLVLLGVTLVVPGLVLPTFSRLFVDEILVGGQSRWLMPLLIGMTLTALARAALTSVQNHYLTKLETALAISSAGRLFWHMVQLPLEFYTQRYAGEIGSRLAISARTANLVANRLPSAALHLLTAVFFLVVMFTYDFVLAGISLAFALGNVGLLAMVSRRRKAMNQKLAIDSGKVLGASMNGLAMIETLKASGAESEFFEKWSGYQARWLGSMQQLSRSSLLLNVMPAALSALEVAALVGIGGLRVIDGAMTLGMLVAFQSLAQSFSEPVTRLVELGDDIQQLQGDMDRQDDVLKSGIDPSMAALGHRAPSGKLQGLVELKNVTFGYNRSAPPLLMEFNLRVEPGQRIALVGHSGCGKSTVAKLLTGLFQPWEGEVLLDGHPRGELDRQQLALSLAMVDQDISLFEDSVRNNLTLWDETVPEEALVRAAEDACVHSLIMERPGGYDACVEEGGRNFSGGQRQRMELARALANDPRVLILDEATSALDPAVEKQIDRNLRRRGCTCIIVAHRLSTVRDCDRIYVLDQGRVVEEGVHDELMARPDGLYRRLASST